VLESVICLARGDRAELGDLPQTLRGDIETILLPSYRRQETLRHWASRYVRLVWQRCDQNKRRACTSLGISYHTLQAHLRYGNRVVWAREPLSVGPATRADRSEQRPAGMTADTRRGMSG
jgi:hypothetical protein